MSEHTELDLEKLMLPYESREDALMRIVVKYKALIRKLVEAGEGAEKTFILIHKLRNFRDEKDLRADECREEIKILASTLSAVIEEAKEVLNGKE